MRGHADIDSKLKEGGQSLPDLNLSKYEILDCEPLHDIKGHLANILPEIGEWQLTTPGRLQISNREEL